MATELKDGKVTPEPVKTPVEGAKPAEKPVEGAKPNEPALGEKKVEEKPVDDGAKPDEIVEPVALEAYALTLPDTDSPFTDADLPLYNERAKRLGLTQKQAQKMVETEAAEITAANVQFIADLKADKELGGDKLDASLALAKQGRDAVLKGLPEEERNTILGWLGDPRLKIGNHKALVRMFAHLGKLLQEDRPPLAPGGGATPRDAASVLWPSKS